MVMLDPVIEEVQRRIISKSISIAEAAGEIGVGASSLTKHLGGGYVRSDSLAKYRQWLAGSPSKSQKRSNVDSISKPSVDVQSATPLDGIHISPELTARGKLNVVDLFCGCGGMSLGFERFQQGEIFKTVLALDIEAPMVRVFNDNHPSASEQIGVARQADISDFMNEAEVLAFYLEHLARTTANRGLAAKLRDFSSFGLDAFRGAVARIDSTFLEDLTAARLAPDYQASIREMGGGTLGQTSVIGFHSAIKLPISGSSQPKMGPLIWYGDGFVPATSGINAEEVSVDPKLVDRFRRRMRKLWDAEVSKLTDRATGSGRGQLASAAERIERFLRFLSSNGMRKVRSIWVEWRAQREALRVTYFDDATVVSSLRAIYEDGHRVSVLLGGPPCQGFSRIGRGKIRSLREQSLHVQEDEDSVDSRNQLMHQYVMFVAALAPDVFLFENVRHFQAVVRSEGVEFDAADVLAEAISNVSTRGLGYTVAKRIVMASQHAIPQNRERFVMAGVRKDVASVFESHNAAVLCLGLKRYQPVPLRVALEGLPSPSFSNDIDTTLRSSEVSKSVAGMSSSAEEVYRQWTFSGTTTDAHVARPPRSDDAAFFSLMGPGKRWMDYRCDDSETLLRLSSVLERLQLAFKREPGLAKKLGIKPSEVESLSAVSDGSLSLRMLLECISPLPGEEEHHLLTATYLNKREGSHGDWLARMDANQPSKTVVSHMAKDTYAFVHPFAPRTISVREAARIQAFPDDYKFGSVGLVDGFRVVGNAVPPLLTLQFAELVGKLLSAARVARADGPSKSDSPRFERSVLVA